MAVFWEIARFILSSSTDLETIVAELTNREEDGWDLEYVVSQDGFLILFFKKTV